MTPDWTAISLGLFPQKLRKLEASTTTQPSARIRIAQEKLAQKTQRIESCLIEKLIQQLQQSKSAGNTYAQSKRKNMDAISWRKSNDEHLGSIALNRRTINAKSAACDLQFQLLLSFATRSGTNFADDWVAIFFSGVDLVRNFTAVNHHFAGKIKGDFYPVPFDGRDADNSQRGRGITNHNFFTFSAGNHQHCLDLIAQDHLAAVLQASANPCDQVCRFEISERSVYLNPRNFKQQIKRPRTGSRYGGDDG
jgi:hypothetical protein